jgi:hypothetical protein
MKYLKTYEGIIKASDASYLPINDEITKIVSDSLRKMSIYKKETMESLIDNVFNDIELIWTDLQDELDNFIDVKIERCNTIDFAGKNLNGVFFNAVSVLIKTPYYDLNEQEVYDVIDTNKRCEEVIGLDSKISGRDPKFYGISKNSTLVYYYVFNDCINFWEKVRYNTGEEKIYISLYHQKFGHEIYPITWEKTTEIKEDLLKDIKPKLRELGIAPIISYGGSVGCSGRKDIIDIKFFKLKV